MSNNRFIIMVLIGILLSAVVVADGYLDRGESRVRSSSLQSHASTLSINEKGINIQVTYPKVVQMGEYFTIKASMTNNIDYSRMGGLTLSFPQMTSVVGDILHRTFDSVDGYAPYSKIYNKHLGKATRSKYYMIEGWEKSGMMESKRKFY